MHFVRTFTTEGAHSFDSVEFEARRCQISNHDGSAAFEMDAVIFPTSWSQNAANVVAQKYLRKAGVPDKTVRIKEKGIPEWCQRSKPAKDAVFGAETDIRQTLRRLAGTWTYWGFKMGLFSEEADGQIFYDEVLYTLIHQMWAPNSPQWFNTGLHWAYGIEGPPQGHYYVDSETDEVVPSSSAYERPQPHACQPAWALVSTPEGMVPIVEIVREGRVGLEVFDREGTTKVVAVSANGVKGVRRLHLRSGRYVDVTGDHLVLVSEHRKDKKGEFLPAQEVEEGMRLHLPMRPERLDEGVGSDAQMVSEAALAGWLLTDGFVGQYGEGSNRSLIVEFETVYDEELSWVKKHLEVVFSGVAFNQIDEKVDDPRLTYRRLRASGEQFRGFVERWGLLDRRENAKVPSCLYGASHDVLMAFLKSIFQADGHVAVRRRDGVVSGQVGFDKISREFCSGVQLLLSRVGIFSRLQVRNDSREDRKQGWRVSIGILGDARRFAEIIGFLSVDKQQLLRERCLLDGRDVSELTLDLVTEIEDLGEHEVFDIQTESGTYLSNHVVVHNCFIQSVGDDLVNPGGIMDLWVREARLFKYGSGTGTNFSGLRGAGERLSGGGVSSGVMSWLRIGDRSAQGIQSGGTTRRAAKMVVLDDDHPEICEFVNWKVTEEKKVAAMVAGSRACEKSLNDIVRACHSMEGEDRFDPKKNERLGDAVLDARDLFVPDSMVYRAIELAKQGVTRMDFPILDTDWQGAAYDTVSGQQSNNSVSVTQRFLQAVETKDDWTLIRRTDGGVHKTIPAASLWADLTYAAWACADPGLHFNSTMNEWHTCSNDEPIRATNPCSEYVFIDDTACNLASLNLVKFEAYNSLGFSLETFVQTVHLVTTVLEISVGMSQLPSAAIARKTYDYRTLGLGYANLGALLMRRGLPYDSPEARGFAGALTALMTGEAYCQSARMAECLGAFPRFEANREPMMKVMGNHRAAALGFEDDYKELSIEPRGLKSGDTHPELLVAAGLAWKKAIELGSKHGYRNAQVSAIAPTGTISIEMDCDTTGVEPDFALVKFKSLAGGGGMTIINQSVPVALQRLGYSAAQIETIVHYISGHRKLSEEVKGFLTVKGFTGEMIERVENALRMGSPHIALAISEMQVGRSDLLEFTELTPEDLSKGVDLLTLLGMNADKISEANLYSVGAMTIEGAPGLKDAHLPVFDCANRCGLTGKRSISARGHVDMMGAVQPFVSGAISKTVNMPRDATLEDVRSVYHRAWKVGVKAIALYRDGSKMSQPLGSRLAAELFEGLKRSEPEVSSRDVVHQVAERMVIRYISERRKLPFKRSGYTQKAIIGGHKVFLRTGEYDDGTLGELFIDTHKEGAAFRSLLAAFAMAVSVGLQHGVPLEKLVDLYTFTKYEPNGPVFGDAQVKTCTSLLDWVFRHLAVSYLGREDLAHVKSEDLDPDTLGEPEPSFTHEKDMGSLHLLDVNDVHLHDDDTSEVAIKHTFMATTSTSEMVTTMSPSEIARASGYEGDPCPSCGQFMLVRTNGSCTKCTNCGDYGGCS